jgi:hypothetical protein
MSLQKTVERLQQTKAVSRLMARMSARASVDQRMRSAIALEASRWERFEVDEAET